MTARLSRPVGWEDEWLVSARFDDDEDEDLEEDLEEELDEELDEALDEEDEGFDDLDENEYEAFDDDELYDDGDDLGSRRRRRGEWD